MIIADVHAELLPLADANVNALLFLAVLCVRLVWGGREGERHRDVKQLAQDPIASKW